MLKLYISNKIEQLSRQFAKHIGDEANCFSSEWIILQTSGMERWLALQTAQHNGVFTNFQFIKPNTFIDQLYKMANLNADLLYNTENLKWLIFRFLNEDDFITQFPNIAQYYRTDDIKRLQLSVKIADLFDQYLLYRQNYIEAWNKGELAKITPQKDKTEQQNKAKQAQLDQYQKWQLWLWAKIKKELPQDAYDKVEMREMLIRQLKDSDFQAQIKSKYQKLSLFGLSVITDYHIEIFHYLSKFITVNLYFLNPAPETYWYDIVSERFVYYIEKKTGQSIEELKLHLGNELLSNYSALAKDTYNILFKSDDFVNAIDDSLIEKPNNNTLLEKIQNDIFHNLNYSERNKITLSDLTDESLIISSSYTPMREVEALYNQLLHFLDTSKNLQASDIIVQVSDVDLYTPYIRAVFDNSPHHLPYTIADRSYAGQETIVGVLDLLLKLSQEDFTSKKILQLLNSEAIRNRFGLTNLDLIRELVQEANIRFGIKGYAKDDTRYVSWLYGLERILLGYAMRSEEEYFLDEYSSYPLDKIEGSDAEELLRFKAFIDQLIRLLDQRTLDRPLNEWKKYIENLIEHLIYIDEQAEVEIKYIQKHLIAIENMTDWLEESISYEVFQKSFIDALFSNPRAGHFITGGITFCSMIPMRSIPFKVIAMLGLNGDSFPRTETKIAFDLSNIEYKRGDRNTKNNDKYLFLETILSARQHLYLSYIGHSTKDNSEFNPSLLIDELKSYIEMSCSEIPKGKTVDDYILQQHPLHAFSQKYLDQSSPLFTYLTDKKSHLNLSEQKIQKEESVEIVKLNIYDLIRFFDNPFKYYYNKILQIYYQENDHLLPEAELFELDSLQHYSVKSDLFYSQESIDKYIQKAKKTGRIPLANMAPISVKNAYSEIENIKKQYQQLTHNIEETSVNISVSLGTITLQASIKSIYKDKHIFSNVSNEPSKAKYLLQAWLLHLVLMANKQKIDTVFIAKYLETPLVLKHTLLKPQEAQEILNKLIQIYLKGQNQIIAFSPSIGYNLASKLMHDANDATKLDKILTDAFNALKQMSNPYSFTGIYDEYMKRESEMGYFEEEKHIKTELKDLSELIFTPLLKHIT